MKKTMTIIERIDARPWRDVGPYNRPTGPRSFRKVCRPTKRKKR